MPHNNPNEKDQYRQKNPDDRKNKNNQGQNQNEPERANRQPRDRE